MTDRESMTAALLVSIRYHGVAVESDRMDETRELIRGLGINVVETKSFTLREPLRFLLGSGQVTELRDLAQALRVEMIVVDTELTALQYRHFVDNLGTPVMDRDRLILETFASQAKTAEARLRVQIAERMYELTQLRAMTAGYDQQAGHIGMRGPGETLFEKRRRAKRDEIHRLKEQLRCLDTRYAVKARSRQEVHLPKVAVVGYTNAGKSTLVNLLAGSTLLAEDKLFATLDTAARLARIGQQVVILIDTVGFIQKLPTSLLDSFRSTLEEARNADLLLHIVDAGVADVTERIEIVRKVLTQIGCEGVPELLVLNKIDTLDESRRRAIPASAESAAVSLTTGEGMSSLRDRIHLALASRLEKGHYVIPFSNAGAHAELYRSSVVVQERATDFSWILDVTEKAPGAGLPSRYRRRGRFSS
jgi:GTP-binding protein HflX